MRSFLRNSVFTLVIVVFFYGGAVSEAKGEVPPPLQQTPAFQQYLKRPPTELSKLIYLMDYYRTFDVIVIYDGNEYDVAEALRYAKKYLAENYKSNEKALSWLKANAYRSKGKGNVIYVKFSDGQFRPMLDVLLEQLEALEKANPK